MYCSELVSQVEVVGVGGVQAPPLHYIMYCSELVSLVEVGGVEGTRLLLSRIHRTIRDRTNRILRYTGSICTYTFGRLNFLFPAGIDTQHSEDTV